MKFSELLSFKEDVFFNGAVQVDWFYEKEKSSLVAENFMFHGKEYHGAEGSPDAKLKDTVQFVYEIAEKLDNNQKSNFLNLAIASYGTGKSHLAVTLAELLSGSDYKPATYKKIIENIERLGEDSKYKAGIIKQYTQRPNLVLVLNGMRDFNLNYELLSVAQKSLTLYGCSTEKLKKINRSLEVAGMFFERNCSDIQRFEKYAAQFKYKEKGSELIEIIKKEFLSEKRAYSLINAVYKDVNGSDIRIDEGVSATVILNTLLKEYCGDSSEFDNIIIIFDEFGRYLEYASSSTSAESGDYALQQMYEVAQASDGQVKIVTFIQSDIKSYLQRVDRTTNISRYIGRYESSDKYYLSSNLETIFANLVNRKDEVAFKKIVTPQLKKKDCEWRTIFDSLNKWVSTKGIWKYYDKYRNVVVQGIYPLHPISTYMLSQLSDYLQNRSSIQLIGQHFKDLAAIELQENEELPFVYPESILKDGLFSEMLEAEEKGRRNTRFCISFNNISGKYEDKLDDDCKKVLRANLIIRILHFRTADKKDVIDAIQLCTGLTIEKIEKALNWLTVEYAILGFDDHAGHYDFLEDSTGAHDFRTFFTRAKSRCKYDKTMLGSYQIKEYACIQDPENTGFNLDNHIKSKEWQFNQDLYAIEDVNMGVVNTFVKNWQTSISPDKPKGQIVWLYAGKSTEGNEFERIRNIAEKVQNVPIVFMVLNDSEDRLCEALIEHSVIKNISDKDRQKYGPFIAEKEDKNKKQIEDIFYDLKKEGHYISVNGYETLLESRKSFLTKVFSNLYNKAIPFYFDGFDLIQTANARKSFCTICKMLLLGNLNEAFVQSLPKQDSNRIKNTLMETSPHSWKCVTNEYQVMEPLENRVKEIYRVVESKLVVGKSVELQEILDELTRPPFGLNDYEVVYLFSVIYAQLKYCLKISLNGATIAIQQWVNDVIGDNKVDFKKVGKTELLRVDPDKIEGVFVNLFNKIRNNNDILLIEQLEDDLKNLIQEEKVPDSLLDKYQLAKNRLDEGKQVKNAWEGNLDRVLLDYDSLIESNNIFTGLRALKNLRSSDIYSTFNRTTYTIPDDYTKKVNDYISKITVRVEPNIISWIKTIKCHSVQDVNSFKSKMENHKRMLQSLGYNKEAQYIDTYVESETKDLKRIQARADFKTNYAKYLETKIEGIVPFLQLKEWIEKGKQLLEVVGALGDFLENNAKYKSAIIEHMKPYEEAIAAIKEEIKEIYDYVYGDIRCLDDINQAVLKIQMVCGKAIDPVDLSDLKSLESELKEAAQVLDALDKIHENRSEYLKLKDSAFESYADKELDFDIVTVLEDVCAVLEKDIDDKEKAWFDKYLTTSFDTFKVADIWLSETLELPKYLKEETIALHKDKKLEAQKIRDKYKVESAFTEFQRMNSEQQQKFIEKLKTNRYI